MLTFSWQPEGDRRLGDFLQRNLTTGTWTEFRAAVAFVKRSGVRHIKEPLSQFLERGGAVKIAVGVDLGGTSIEGLTDLLATVRDRGELWVFHNEIPSTFHPKVYAFKEDSRAEVYVGSGNLTEGGLFTNYEAGFQASLDLTSETDQGTYQEVTTALTEWASGNRRNGQLLTDGLLARLIALRYVVPERETVSTEDEAASTETGPRSGASRERLFAAVGVQRAPRVRESAVRPVAGGTAAEVFEGLMGFVMTLQQTDVGTGQVTEGTSRRSPEIFIPLVARDAAPEFWGFPSQFREDAARPGKMDRTGVRMRIGGEVIDVNMMTWPDKHDFRLRSEALRSAGNVGDILRLEKAPAEADFQYYAEVIPFGTSQFDRFAALCTQPVRNSQKLFGYY